MSDKDQEMLDYIDEYIVRDRTSDAAEDSAGAAWAAYERGEYDVPDWYRKEHRAKNSGKTISAGNTQKKPSLNWDTFLKSMGILFLVLLGFFLILTLIGLIM